MVADVETRWNSTHDCIERFSLMYDVLVIAFAENVFETSDGLTLPKRDELDNIRRVSAILRPLKQFSKFIQGSKYLTSPFIPILIQRLIGSIETNVVVEENNFAYENVEALRNALVTSLKKRFEKTLEPNSPVMLAAYLHPVTFRCMYKKNSSSAVNVQVRDRLAEWMKELDDAVDSKVSEESSSDELNFEGLLRDGDVPDAGANRPARGDAGYKLEIVSLFKELGKAGKASTNLTVDDLSNATLTSLISKMQKDNLIREFYATQSPLVKRLARTVLSGQPTTASGERVFSASGLISSALRSRMCASTLEATTVISCHLKNSAKTEVDNLLTEAESVLESPDDILSLQRFMYSKLPNIRTKRESMEQ